MRDCHRREIEGAAGRKKDVAAQSITQRRIVDMKPLIVAFALTLAAATMTESSRPADKFPELVSLIQLISTPQVFDGVVVQVVGFLRIEFEGNALYLHKDDFEQRISKNSVWVSLDAKSQDAAAKLNMQYVILIGTFDTKNKGHMSLRSGALLHIGQMSAWPPQALRAIEK
jgi:hypothetical protein